MPATKAGCSVRRSNGSGPSKATATTPTDPNVSLPEADELPPQHADSQPDDQIHDGDQEADLPPGRLSNVTKSEIDRSGAGSVVRDARVEIGKIRKRKSGDYGR